MIPIAEQSTKDTIVARATSSGAGAIGIVRLSGPKALDIAQKLTPGHAERKSHQFALGVIRDLEGRAVDEAMLVEMHGPRSYTGEDIVEIHLHGARTIVESVLSLCQEHGARLAGPGEYTLRAYLNGRLDLAQAEAVGELVASQNESQSSVALAQLKGGLSRKVKILQRDIEAVVADMQAVLDFPEYPTGEGYVGGHLNTLKKIEEEITNLVSDARVEFGKGRRVALCGAPNVGKSSLINRWMGEERVLVDGAPGTTRDPIEVELGRGLQRWSVWDTAGIRSEAEGLEKRGIEMARERALASDLVVWLVCGVEPQWPDLDCPVWVVGSKMDLVSSGERQEIEREAAKRQLEWKGWISNISGEGVQELRDIFELHFDPPLSSEETVVVKERHLELLRAAGEGIQRFYKAAQEGMTLDVLSYELEDAARALGMILGKDVDEALLDRIFSEFCIGK